MIKVHFLAVYFCWVFVKETGLQLTSTKHLQDDSLFGEHYTIVNTVNEKKRHIMF